MPQLGDTSPTEQPERAQPPLTLDDVLEAERLAALDRQLALDRRGAGPVVADDQDVVDEDLRTLFDHDRQIGLRMIVVERDAGVCRRGLVSAVQVLQHDPVEIGGELRPVEGLAGLRGQPLGQDAVVEVLIAVEYHRGHSRGGAFDNLNRHVDDSHIHRGALARCGRRLRLDVDGGVAAAPVGFGDARRARR